MACIVKSLPEFKALERFYGERLAESFVMNYSIKVKKLNPSEDLYYPSIKEVKAWLNTDQVSTGTAITKALELNPYLSENAILSLLKGVVHRLDNKLYITRGFTNYGSLVEQAAATSLIFEPNVRLLKGLEKRFPNIFSIKDVEGSEFTKVVGITPVTSRDMADRVEERASDVLKFTSNFPYARKTLMKERAFEVADKLGKKLQQAMGVPYESISAIEAQQILEDSTTPYDNQPAFYYNNKIYFVGDYVTPDIVLHEYAHPLIKAIEVKNSRLFNKLYTQLETTTPGQQIIADVTAKYPELAALEDQSRFKQECLVTALERKANAKVDDLISTEAGFRKFITNLIYAIKQILKSLVKNVDLKTLNENTTLDQLANMMVSEDFQIERIVFDESDFAEFKKDYDGIIKEFEKVKPENLQDAINKFYSTMNYLSIELKKAPFKLKKELTGKDGIKIFNYIKENLRPYQSVDVDPSQVEPENAIQAAMDMHEEFKQQALNLVHSVDQIEIFVENTDKILDNMASGQNLLNTETISKIKYFEDVLTQNEDLINSIRKTIGLSKNNEFVQRINGIKNTIDDTMDKIKDLKFKFVLDFYSDESTGMKENVEKKFVDDITRYFKAEKISDADTQKFLDEVMSNPLGTEFAIKNQSLAIPNRIAKFVTTAVKEYYAKRLGRDQFEDFLTGKRGDMGLLASMFTPYMNMNDPIVGSFARFANNQLAKFEREALETRDKFLNNVFSDLRAVGYTGNNVQATAKKIFFIDEDGYRDSKTGEFKKFEKWTLLNKHKNWRFMRGELQNNFQNAIEKKDKAAIKEAYQALETFDEKYMYRRYKPEVYNLRKMWTQENEVIHPDTKAKINVSAETSFEAYVEKQAKLQAMNTVGNMEIDELEDLTKMSQADAARLEYERLFEVRNPDGTMKTGKDLEKALVLKKHRSESSKFYNTEPDIDRVQNALDNHIIKLASVGITPDEKPDEFNAELEKFVKNNFRTAYTQEYYDLKRNTVAQIREILDQPGRQKSDVAEQLADLYSERFQLVNQVTDKNGQPNGLQFDQTKLERINKLENKIADIEAKFDKFTGLTKEETYTLKKYQQKLINGQILNKDEEEEYEELVNAKNKFGLPALEMEKLKSLFNTLKDLSSKEPTEYYVEAFNYAIRGLDLEELTVDNADEYINSPKIIQAITKSDDFKNWFKLNHYEKEVYNPTTKEMEKKIFRISAWTVAKPNNDESYKTTTLTNPVTGDPMIIKGVPSNKYARRNVRDEFKTGYNPATGKVELIVGKHVNNKYEFLPRDYNPGAADSAADNALMNERYLELERSNNADFQLLKKMTQEVLAFQEKGLKSSKQYLDLPRFYHRTNLELMQSGQTTDKLKSLPGNIKTAATRLVDRFKTPDAAEQGFNYDTEQLLVTTDLNGNPISKIPIRGMYKLNVDDVSLDFMRAYGDYMQSLIEQKALREIEPMALAIGDIVNDPENAIKNTKLASREVKKATGLLAFLPKTGDNKRAEAFNYFIDKTFYGKKNSTFQEENILTTKIANMLMHVSSRSIIGFDLVSASVNRFGMVFQSMIEAAAGNDVTFKSLATGKIKALKTITELSAKGIYTVGPKSLNVQIMEYFDPITGKTEKDFSKSSSRTLLKDMADLTWMYDARRLAEVEAGLELFWGMMDNKFIDQKQPDGTVKKIKYSEAFELDSEGLIKLKDGIDPEYGPKAIKHEFKTGETLLSIATKYNMTEDELKTRAKITDPDALEEGDVIQIASGKAFDDFRLRIQGRGFKLNGTIDDFNSPQASKYLTYRLFSFYKNYALGFILNRFQMDTSRENFGGAVYDWNLNTTTKGYYIAGFQGMWKTIKSLGKDWPLLSEEEKQGIYKTMMEGLMIATCAIAITFLFGYDPDDEERFEKLRQREKEYGIAGTLSNHLLYQVMKVKSENEAFFPILGTDDMLGLVQNTSIAFSQLQNMNKLMQDVWHIATGDDSALYKSDVGPYPWQEQGDYKLWNHLGAVWGVKGKNYDPIYAIKNKETAENLGL